MDETEMMQAVHGARTCIAETIDSATYVARCMRDAAADLRRRASRLDAASHRYSIEKANLSDRRARALHLAAHEIDRAADAYAEQGSPR